MFALFYWGLRFRCEELKKKWHRYIYFSNLICSHSCFSSINNENYNFPPPIQICTIILYISHITLFLSVPNSAIRKLKWQWVPICTKAIVYATYIVDCTLYNIHIHAFDTFQFSISFLFYSCTASLWDVFGTSTEERSGRTSIGCPNRALRIAT